MGKTNSEPLISICIPTFKEERYIVDTVARLKNQSLFDFCEIVICDYDPSGVSVARREISRLLKNQVGVKIIDAGRKGIGYARHMAIMASSGRYIVNFDADCYFHSVRAIDDLVYPIHKNDIMITACPNVLSEQEISEKSIPSTLYNIRNWLETARILPTFYEPGLTFSRDVYNRVGGFRDVQSCEAPLFAIDAALRIGYDNIRVLNNVYVVVSARRAGNIFKFLELNYDKAYRGDRELNVT